jgi:hypothetical protein
MTEEDYMRHTRTDGKEGCRDMSEGTILALNSNGFRKPQI